MSTDPPTVADPDEVEQLRRECADLRAIFVLGYNRMGEASDRWRAEDPEARALIMPDLGALLAWLMADADRARGELADARAALQQAKDRFDAIEAAYADILHREIEHRGHGRDGHLNEQDLKVFFDALYRSGAVDAASSSGTPQEADRG